jgi:hypothetical protein
VKKLLTPILFALPTGTSSSIAAHVAERGTSFLILFPFSSFSLDQEVGQCIYLLIRDRFHESSLKHYVPSRDPHNQDQDLLAIYQVPVQRRLDHAPCSTACW